MAPTDANRRTITALQREERGDRPSGHRTPRFHHQAPVLLGTEEEIPGQVRPDVESEPYDGGFGIMRDAQAAKPQSFRTGDGWFAYNLAVNLAQM